MRQFVINKTITDKTLPSIKSYFSEVQPIKVLTPEEEYEIAVKAFNGDEKSKELLVKHNLKFVISVAKQYTVFGVKVEDLISEGNLGLIKAANRFDPSKGFKFISYAIWSIRQSMIAYIQEHGKTIRLPVNKSNLFISLKKEYMLLEQKLQRNPSYNDLIDNLRGVYCESDIEFFINTYNNRMESLDAPLGNDEEGVGTLMDVISNPNRGDMESFINSNDSEIRIKLLIRALNEQEQTILKLLYGLDSKEPLTIKEVGSILGISVARVSLVRDKALRKIKYKLLHKGKWLRQK